MCEKEEGMKKFAISLAAGFLLFCALGAGWSPAGDDWELWLYTPVSYKVTKEVKVDLTGIFKWKNDMEDFYYRSYLLGGYYSVTPWLDLGVHSWYKETRKTIQDDWGASNTMVGRINFNYKLTDWCVLKEQNRLEFDFSKDRWKLRMKPVVEFPLTRLGLSWLKVFVDNEFFFAFDYPDDLDIYSENRVTTGLAAKVVDPFGISVAYRNVGKKSATTDQWDFTNVLALYAKLAF